MLWHTREGTRKKKKKRSITTTREGLGRHFRMRLVGTRWLFPFSMPLPLLLYRRLFGVGNKHQHAQRWAPSATPPPHPKQERERDTYAPDPMSGFPPTPPPSCSRPTCRCASCPLSSDRAPSPEVRLGRRGPPQKVTVKPSGPSGRGGTGPSKLKTRKHGKMTTTRVCERRVVWIAKTSKQHATNAKRKRRIGPRQDLLQARAANFFFTSAQQL